MMTLIHWVIEQRLLAEEKDHGVSLAYLRCMLRVSPAHFFKFLKVMPLAGFRRALPPDVYHLARIVTARHEDCGSCLQMEVHQAMKAGVVDGVLRASIENNPCALPSNLAEVHLFTQALLEHTGEEDLYRQSILQRYGENGLIELAIAIAVCRMFPTVKRALGFSSHCVSGTIESVNSNRLPRLPTSFDVDSHLHG